MNADKLKKILAAHKAWLNGRPHGKRADLHQADLRSADLCGATLRFADLRRADLRRADLRGADLFDADLRSADLRSADLRRADLRSADLRRADLRSADLRGADLQDADLRDADLRDANIDYSCWPLWCGSLSVKIGKRLAAQLLYHALRAMESCADDKDVAAVLRSEAAIALANKFHRVSECGLLEVRKGGMP